MQSGHPVEAEAVKARASLWWIRPLASKLLVTLAHHSGKSFNSLVRFGTLTFLHVGQSDIAVCRACTLVRQPYRRGVPGVGSMEVSCSVVE